MAASFGLTSCSGVIPLPSKSLDPTGDHEERLPSNYTDNRTLYNRGSTDHRRMASVDSQKRGGLVGAPYQTSPLHITNTMAASLDSSWREIQRLCQHGELDMALAALLHMDHHGIAPSHRVYWCLLKACNIKKSLHHSNLVSMHITHDRQYNCHGMKFKSMGPLDDYLIATLVKCGGLDEALQIFHKLPHRTVFSWTAVISGYADRGKGQEALQMYQGMLEEGVEPNEHTFVSLFKACGSIPDLEEGKELHVEAWRKGFVSDVFVISTLVSMYGKCGSIQEAEDVFGSSPRRNIVSWNAMLSAYGEQGNGEKALQLYRQMLEEGIGPNNRTIVIALQACCTLADTDEDVVEEEEFYKAMPFILGQALHADAWRYGLENSDVYVNNTLISLYSKCGKILEAENVFARMERNVVSWTLLLSAYVEQGNGEKALQLYMHMQDQGMSPNVRTFVTALQACCTFAEKEEAVHVKGRLTKMISLELTQALQADAEKEGFTSDAFVGNTLVSLYAKCGDIVEMENVFCELRELSVVSWNVMLSAYDEQGEGGKAMLLYRQMQEEGVTPNDRTLVNVIQACCTLAEKEEAVDVKGRLTKPMSLEIGRALHAHAWKKGFDSNVFLGTTLICMYAKCGSIVEAGNVFDGLPQQEVVAWTALLSAYVESDEVEMALQLYVQMQEEGVSPNERTFVIVLQACCMLAEKEDASLMDGKLLRLKSLEIGRVLHVDAQRKGFDSFTFVGSTLVSLFGKCGSILEAENVFNVLSQHDVTSWTAMMLAYGGQGEGEKALQLYRQMQEEGVNLNERTFVLALQASSTFAEKEDVVMPLEIGQALHANARRKGFDLVVFVGNTLISVYGKCGNLAEAENVFIGLLQRNVASWTVMLSAYVEQGESEKALQIYKQMQKEGVSPDERVFVMALKACCVLAEKEKAFVRGRSAKVVSLKIGKALHADAQRKGFDMDVFVGSILVTMYLKCGSIALAEDMFNRLSQRNSVTWTAMLSAYVERGKGEKSLQLYSQMQEEYVTPDDFTLVSILQACSDTGNVEICRQIHFTFVSVGYDSTPLLANTLMNTYGRCATMVDAQAVFDVLAQPDVVSWTALIAGYAREGNSAVSQQTFEQMQLSGVKPNMFTFLSILSACSHAGLVGPGLAYFESMSKDYSLVPEMEHHVSMIDLLGRAGDLGQAEDLLLRMPTQPDLALWLCLLGACQKHGDVVLGKQVLDWTMRLHPNRAAAYVLMSNMFADTSLWEYANELDDCGLIDPARKKSIDHEQELLSSKIRDHRTAQHDYFWDLLQNMSVKLKKKGDIPQMEQKSSGLVSMVLV